jgi:hypothetical protein
VERTQLQVVKTMKIFYLSILFFLVFASVQASDPLTSLEKRIFSWWHKTVTVSPKTLEDSGLADFFNKIDIPHFNLTDAGCNVFKDQKYVHCYGYGELFETVHTKADLYFGIPQRDGQKFNAAVKVDISAGWTPRKIGSPFFSWLNDLKYDRVDGTIQVATADWSAGDLSFSHGFDIDIKNVYSNNVFNLNKVVANAWSNGAEVQITVPLSEQNKPEWDQGLGVIKFNCKVPLKGEGAFTAETFRAEVHGFSKSPNVDLYITASLKMPKMTQALTLDFTGHWSTSAKTLQLLANFQGQSIFLKGGFFATFTSNFSHMIVLFGFSPKTHCFLGFHLEIQLFLGFQSRNTLFSWFSI